MNRYYTKNVYIILFGLIGLAIAAPAEAQSITLQGRVTNASGQPITGATTAFRVQILTPNSSQCVLYDESQTLDLSQSEGLFSIKLNSGAGTVNAPTTYTLDQAVSNATSFSVNSTYCQGATGTVVYSPVTIDNRKVLIQFKDPGSMSAFESIPVVDLNPVAYAMEGRTVGGFPASSLVRVADSGMVGTATPITSAGFTELLNLINGTSTNYMSSSGSSASGARLPSYSSTPSSAAAGSIWFDSTNGVVKYVDQSGITQTLSNNSSGGGTITAVNTPAGSGLTGGATSGPVSLSLTTSGVTAATYGSSSTVPVFTVDAFGRVTSVTNTSIANPGATGAAGGDLSGSYPNPLVAKLQGTPVSSSAPADDQFFKYTTAGGNWSAASLSLSDIKAPDSSNILINGSCNSNQTFYVDGTGHMNCQAIGSLNASAITTGTLAVGVMPALSGDVTSAAGSTALTLAATGVTANTYKSVTVDAKGRVLSGSNPSTLAGFGITDSVQNTGGLPSMAAGADASRSSAGTAGRLYVASDTFKIYRDNGTGWDLIASATGSGGTITNVAAGNGLTGGGSTGSVTVSMPNVMTVGTFTKVVTDVYGRVTSGGTLTAVDIPSLPWSQISGTPTTLAGYDISNGVANAGAAISLQAGAIANMPAPGSAGRIYIGTDNNTISYDTGSSWTTITSGTGFTGSLAGDVTGSQSSTVVAKVGGVTAANVASGANASNAATSANTASTIVARDASGKFAAGAASLSSALFRDSSTNTITVKAPTTVTTYSLTLPAAVGSANQVLQTDASGNLSWTNQTASTTVTGTAPISVAANAVSIAQATSSVNGYLSSADWTTFNGKLSSVLNSAMIWVGNASNVATSVTPSGDVSLSNAGVFAVNAIKGKTVSAAPTTVGQVLRYDGTNITPNFLSMGDLRSTVSGSSALSSSCTASQTMYWSSGTDNLGCQSIGGLNASSVFTSGVLPIANGGTGAATTTAAYVFAGPVSGGSGAPLFRQLASTDLPTGSLTGTGTTGYIPYFSAASTLANSPMAVSGTNVGIGTTAPSHLLSIQGASTSSFVAMDLINTGTGGRSFSIGSTGAGNALGNGYLSFYDNTATASRMIIDPNGNVGIGTAAPISKLHILQTSDSASGGFSTTNSVLTRNSVIWTDANGVSRFDSGTTAAGNIALNGTGAGYVGIGTTNPNYPLQVTGQALIGSPAANGVNVALNTGGPAGTRSLSMYYTSGGTNGSMTGDSATIQAGYGGVGYAPLLMNPSGGNVGVGTTLPGSPLEVDTPSTTNYNSAFSWFAPSTPVGQISQQRFGVNLASTGNAGELRFSYAGNGSSFNAVQLGLFGMPGNLTIQGGGNVGIGTTSPQSSLDVSSTQRLGMIAEGSQTATDGSNQVGIISASTFSPTSSTTNTSMFYGGGAFAPPSGVTITNGIGLNITGGSQSGAGSVTNGYGLYVNNPAYGTNKYAAYFGGSVGIGTTTPGYKLDVQGGDINASGYVRSNGTALSSDARWKRDIQPVQNALKRLSQLRGVNYYWRQAEFPEKHFTDEKQLGVIAQEVEKEFPEAVIPDAKGFKSVNYPALIAPVIEAVKALYAQIQISNGRAEEQGRQIASLKAENEALKKDTDETRARLERLEKLLHPK